MPRGVRDLNTIEGVEKKLSALNKKKSALLLEANQVGSEIEQLETVLDEMRKEELFLFLKKSGKTVADVKTALGI